jgi:hypothetical protein
MLLVLGMSLNDPNLRRFLHARRRRTGGGRAPGPICAVFERGDAHSDDYLRFYWERGWRIDTVYLDSFDGLPGLLRTVAWGPGANPATELSWLDVARDWVSGRLPTEQIFSKNWQAFASMTLSKTVERIRVAFQLQAEELVTASLFLPVNERRGPAMITRVATSRGPLPDGPAGRATAFAKRSLSVARAAPQGIAGMAFLEGNPVDAPFGSKRIDFRFPAGMVKDWNHADRYRDWRSSYAVPVLDTPEWVSVAVVALTSSFSVPFWGRFPDDRRDEFLTELKRYCRKAAKELLENSR